MSRETREKLKPGEKFEVWGNIAGRSGYSQSAGATPQQNVSGD
jgi:hypothetical protein